MTRRGIRSATLRAAALLIAIGISGGPLLAARTPGESPRARWLGISLLRALDRLESRGLRLIYSSDLVQASMRVTVEPHATEPAAILREILAPHGLAPLAGPGGRTLIVRGPPGGSIRGVVRDARDNRPLAAVLLEVPETGARFLSDAAGHFDLGPLAPGTYTVTAALASYAPRRIDKLEVAPGGTTGIDLEMSPKAVATEAVEVTAAQGSSRGDGPAPRDHVRHEEIAAVPQPAGDPLRSLGSVPAVGVSDDSAEVHILGGAADETQFLLDGMELYHPFHLKERRGLYSIVDGDAVSDLSVLGAGFPAEYGGRMGGVIDFESEDPPDAPSMELAAGSEGVRAAGSGTLPFAAGRWLLSARAGYPRETLEALGADPAYRPHYYDLFGKAIFSVGRRTNLTFSILGALDDFGGDNGDPLSEHERHGTFLSLSSSGYAWMTLGTAWSSRLHSRTIVSAGLLSDRRRGTDPGIVAVRDYRSTSLLGIKQDWILEGERHLFKWGADLKSLRADYRYRSSLLAPSLSENGIEAVGLQVIPPASRGVSASPSGEEVAAYASDTIRLGSSVDAEIGLRWSARTYSAPGKATLDPRLSLSWKATGRTTLRAGWGIFSQPQRIDELQVQDGVGTFYPAERAVHLYAGFEHETEGGLRFSATAYQKRMSRLHPVYENIYDPYGFFPEAASDRILVDAASARARGVELSLTGPAGRKLSWWAAGTAARAEENLSGSWVPRSWDQRYTLSWGVHYRPAPLWDLSLSGTHHTGHPTTPVDVRTVTDPGGTTSLVLVPGRLNSVRLAPYNRLDLRLGRTFRTGSSELEIFAGASNLLDAANPCCVENFNLEPLANGAYSADPVNRPGLRRMLFYGIRWKR